MQRVGLQRFARRRLGNTVEYPRAEKIHRDRATDDDEGCERRLNGVCLRDKARADPAFGFELLSRVSTELLGRLQATRLRLLDLYAPSRGRL